MAEITITLTLTREQRLQLFAHLFTYLFCRTRPSFVSPPQITIDTVQVVGSRLLHLCIDEHREVAFQLNPEEKRVVNELLAVLEAEYAQWPQREESAMALQHLTACRQLLQKAEQRAIKSIEREEA